MARFNVVVAILLSMAVVSPAFAILITDTNILNFALNLEYLEAEFYSCATTGKGISKNLRGGGPASIGCQKAVLTGDIATIALEIAADELSHVIFLRSALGAKAVPIPLLNIGTGKGGSFSVAANAALGATLSPPFSPYTNNLFFLHGAFIFEDVGVTAYQGAVALIQNSSIVTAAAGILGTEAYHAGSVRLQLIEVSDVLVKVYGVKVNVIVRAISALRAKLSGAADDSGVLVNGSVALAPTNSNSITFARSVNQVVAIVTAGSKSGKGLFFPNGLNGAINGQPVAKGRKILSVPASLPAVATSTRNLLSAASQVTDVNILNFALNLEYMEAEFYSWAAFGHGIAAKYGGAGGLASTGGKHGNLSGTILALAKDFAADELAHVIFLRTALGAAAVPMPQIDLYNYFAIAADYATHVKLSPSFSPFDSNVNFLIGAFIFEDIGATAYKGAAALIRNKAYLTAAAGILAVEAYHAAAIRTLLFQIRSDIVTQGFYGVPISVITGVISALRSNTCNYVGGCDANIIAGTMSQIVPTDKNSIIFSRVPAQVISNLILGSQSGKGGLFPNGFNGVINGTSVSIGAVASLHPAPTPAPTLPPIPKNPFGK